MEPFLTAVNAPEQLGLNPIKKAHPVNENGKPGELPLVLAAVHAAELKTVLMQLNLRTRLCRITNGGYIRWDS